MMNGVACRNDCDMYLNAELGGTGFPFDSARHWFVCVRYNGLAKVQEGKSLMDRVLHS